VGELRWQRPRNIELNNNFSSKTVNATQIAPWCWQSYPESLAFNRAATVEAQFETQPMSEDCLILDVLVPSKPVSSNLPVLLQIHGMYRPFDMDGSKTKDIDRWWLCQW
jgi:carboxylesterase type B